MIAKYNYVLNTNLLFIINYIYNIVWYLFLDCEIS